MLTYQIIQGVRFGLNGGAISDNGVVRFGHHNLLVVDAVRNKMVGRNIRRTRKMSHLNLVKTKQEILHHGSELYDANLFDVIVARGHSKQWQVWVETGYLTNECCFVFEGSLGSARSIAKSINKKNLKSLVAK